MFMKKLISFSLFAILFSMWMNLEAQNSAITVLDKETGKVIPYANICFEGVENGTKLYSITSLDGLAENKAKEKSVVIISFVGYETIIDTIYPKETKEYNLDTDLFNLNQVVVTATRTEKRLADVPVLTQVVLAKEIETRGISDISTLLVDDIPGIEFHSAGFGTDIKMQGLDATYVLFLVDGERMAGETEGNPDYNRINMNEVERVEIVKGASSALYGSQAMGGVINIITKKPREKVEFRLGGKFSQKNYTDFEDVKTNDDFYFYKNSLDLHNLNLNASLGFDLNKWQLKTSFQQKTHDAYNLTSTDTVYQDLVEYDTIIKDVPVSELPGLRDMTIDQTIKYQFNDKLSFSAKGSYYVHDQYDFKRDNAFDRFEDYNYYLKGKYKFNEGSDIEATYSYDIYKKWVISEKEKGDVFYEEDRMSYSNDMTNFKVLSNSQLGEKHLLTSGLEYNGDALTTDMFEGGDLGAMLEKLANTTVIYVQEDYKINAKLNLVGGFRLDYHSVYGEHFSPKLSAMYKWIPLTFRASYAQGFRAPTLKELFLDWDHLGIFYLRGNPDLVPETNNYISLSSEYNRKNFNASINVYKNWFQNKIGGYWGIADDGKQEYVYANVGEADISGLEILFKYKISKSFFVSGGYSYIEDNQTIDEVNISAVAPHSGNFRIEYSYSRRVFDFKFNVSSRIIGEKDYYESTDITVNGLQEVATFKAHYDPYSLWKVSISQSFHNGISIVLGVDNVFDYKAPIVNFNSSLSPGRRGYISMNIKLDKLYREFSSIIKNRNK